MRNILTSAAYLDAVKNDIVRYPDFTKQMKKMQRY